MDKQKKEDKANRIALVILIVSLVALVIVVKFMFLPELNKYKANLEQSGERISAVMDSEGYLHRAEEVTESDEDGAITSNQNPHIEDGEE